MDDRRSLLLPLIYLKLLSIVEGISRITSSISFLHFTWIHWYKWCRVGPSQIEHLLKRYLKTRKSIKWKRTRWFHHQWEWVAPISSLNPLDLLSEHVMISIILIEWNWTNNLENPGPSIRSFLDWTHHIIEFNQFMLIQRSDFRSNQASHLSEVFHQSQLTVLSTQVCLWCDW